MSGFVRPNRKPAVDPAALERFASGADERRAAVGSAESVPSAVVSAEAPSPAEATAAPVAPTAPTPAAATPAPDLVAAAATAPVVAERRVAAVQLKPPADGAEKASEQVLWRVSPSTLALYNFVFDNTNVKSKQKLLDSILLPELERRAEEIRKGR
ncbi:hypothetical protein HQ619_07760 [Burkholderia gladioli]|uniref:hypothetical protein n=1 Tax=Burkholderia gladioli TaxID=28095 RepID=UPI001560B790|nr:hypothetical protein [Burkholderia gladioli]NRF83821.1 hypothetical protein [Burkholderia gladioli]